MKIDDHGMAMTDGEFDDPDDAERAGIWDHAEKLEQQLSAALARAEAAERAMDEARGDLAAAIAPTDVGGGAAQTARAIIEQRDALAAKNARLREALKWYAAPETWQPGPRMTSMGDGPAWASRGEIDGGRRARAALRAQPGEETSG